MNEIHSSALAIVLFIATTFLSVWLLYRSGTNMRKSLIVIGGWILLQSALALSGFYLNTDALPPRFVSIVAPPLLCIAYLLISKKGQAFCDSLDLGALTYLHILRIPVEICLYMLMTEAAIPELMTFEGRNFDIFSGTTAPLIFIYAFKEKPIKRNLLIVWNIVCLLLLLNIVINAALSVPSPIQMQAFETPNIAILNFPYNLLPGLIVPIVLFAHLVSLRQLFRNSYIKSVN